MTDRRTARPRGSRMVLLCTLVLGATAAGGWRVVALTAAEHDPMTLRVGHASYTVTHVEQVAGLSDADLGGMAHGVQSLVPQDKALIRVTVTVSADGASTDYDARALQAYAAGASVGVGPLGGSLAPGRLQAHGQIEGSLSYVVPRKTSQLVLRAGRLPRAVPLLQVEQGPAVAGHDHAGVTDTPEPHQP